MKSKSIRHLVICALAVLQIVFPLTSIAFARETKATLVDTVTGTVEGFVRDPSETPIPGARVRITNIETGNFRTTITGADGKYQFTLLPLGRYTVEAVKDGYIVAEPNRPALKIQLNRKVEYAPPIILIPQVAPSQTVAPTTQPQPTPQPPPTNSPGLKEEEQGRITNQEDGTRRSNQDEQAVSLLPLGNVRTFDDLAFLAAGVAPPPQVRGVAGPGIGAGIGTPGQFSVNGQRARSNNFTVDGSDNNDEDVGVRRQGFVALVPQSIESVKEVQIVTNLWDAEQGRSMGSQVNAVSKSGTNQIHGAAYDFFNHSGLNARNFFDYSDDKNKTYPLTTQAVDGYVNGQPVGLRTVPVRIVTEGTKFTQIASNNPSEGKDRYQRNQGGGVIGFPIIRDKTFFFGSFERQNIKARQETHFSVPTVAQRGFLSRGATGFNLPGVPVPSGIFSPTFVAGDALWSLFPLPNNPIGPYGGNTYTSVLPADADATIFSMKVDHNFRFFGPDITHALTARYNFTDDERQVPSVGGAIFSGILPKVRTNNLSVFLNTQISPSKANQIRVSYGRTALKFREIRDPYLRPTNTPELRNESFLLNAPILGNIAEPTIPGDPRFPGVTGAYLPVGLSTEGQLSVLGQVVVNPFSPVGTDVYLFPQSRANNTIQFADTFNLYRAEHSLKFGADIRRTQLNSSLNRNYRPQLVFGGSPDLSTGLVSAPFPNLSGLGPTPGYFSGADLASLGIPTSIFQSLAIGNADSTLGLRFWQLNFFANDNWRVRRGLTLDYGLRYELNTVPRDVNSRIENTFGLTQLPQSDPGVAVYTSNPFTPLNPDDPTSLPVPINRQQAINSLNATVAAFQAQLGGRESIFDSDRNNFGGHVGFAWDPFANNRSQAGKTSIRGGAGVYYDVTLGSVVSQSRNVFPNFLPINIDSTTFDYAQNANFVPGQTGVQAFLNPRFIPIFYQQNGQTREAKLIQSQGINLLDAPGGGLSQVLGLIFDSKVGGGLPSGGGIAFTLPDRRLRSPYSLQYNLQIERELFRDFLVNFAYVGSRGIKLARFRTPNGGPNSITVPVDPLGLLATSSVDSVRLAISYAPLSDIRSQNPTRPNPFLGAYTVFDSSAASSYNSFQVTANKRFSQGYQFGFAYTLSHAIDDVSDVFDVAGSFTLPQDDRNLRAERGSANFDIRHRTAISSIGDLPYISKYNDKKGARGLLLGGWQYAMLMSYQTGQPFTVNTTFDVNYDGNYTDRIDTLNGLTMIDSRGQKLALNTNPLNLLAAPQTNGRIGRNLFRGSGVAKTDLSFVKNFGVREGQFVVFRVEAFNLFNRTHFGIPVRVIEAPSFGRSVDTTVGPRQIQFALKYVF